MTLTVRKIILIAITLLLGASLITVYDGNFPLFINYFTHTGNLMTFFLLVGVLLGYIPEKHLLFGTMIGLVINLVYINLLIDNFEIVADILKSGWEYTVLHYLAPYVLIADFIFGLKEAMPSYRTLLIYLWLPVTYVVYAFIYGSATGEYAYFFFNVPETGITGVISYVLAIFVLYLGIGSLLIYAKGWAQKKRLH
mgnify:CR=1 FL=1